MVVVVVMWGGRRGADSGSESDGGAEGDDELAEHGQSPV
jgi:hypothetical protein